MGEVGGAWELPGEFGEPGFNRSNSIQDKAVALF
jgi:hypothetical protein